MARDLNILLLLDTPGAPTLEKLSPKETKIIAEHDHKKEHIGLYKPEGREYVWARDAKRGHDFHS